MIEPQKDIENFESLWLMRDASFKVYISYLGCDYSQVKFNRGKTTDRKMDSGEWGHTGMF